MTLEGTDYKQAPFIPLSELGLTEKETIELSWKLRTFLEDQNLGHKVDASDVCILTVFPFVNCNEILDKDDVINYAIGKCYDKPALLNMGDTPKLLILETIENDFLTMQLNNKKEQTKTTCELGELSFL